MGINTDLNVDPYYDDFSEEKQFNRILFKPAKAVQARELTQIQSILQKQVERFGSNIYKEGTIISGINLTDLPAISYVKLNDTANLDPSIYAKTDEVTYTVTGRTNGLVAEIKKGVGGFQTQEPDLKTFFITYISSQVESETPSSVKEFEQGEVLDITVKDTFGLTPEQAETAYGTPGTIVAQATVATVNNHVGRSAGISCEEGVVYQKGHFIFVTAQNVITEKYSVNPGTVSVGFTINELLISSGIDVTLLDNAAGFNNENAPGADRLKLVPTLIAVATANEPEEFFALKRYVDGNPVRIRDTTQFNSVATEMARRTYDESGNYVTEGFGVSLELADVDGTTKAYAAIAPGKAYVFGNEVRNISSRRLEIEPTVDTLSTDQDAVERTSVSYGQYYKFDGKTGDTLGKFATDGTRHNMYNSATLIGTCSVANVTTDGTENGGRIYVYAIVKEAGQETTVPTKIVVGAGDSGVTGVVLEPVGSVVFNDPKGGGKIFDAGKSSMSSISAVEYVRRQSVLIDTATEHTVIKSGNERARIANAFAITGGNAIKTVIPEKGTGTSSENITFTLVGAEANTVLYYDAVISSTSADALEEKDVYVKSLRDGTTLTASLGVPNCIEILEIVDDYGNGADVTSDYRLVNNQKENFYDISYIKLLQGRNKDGSANLRIKLKFLDRPVDNGYLTINSYSAITKRSLIKDFTSKSGVNYDLLNCFDFRPYAVKQVTTPISVSAAGAGSVTAAALALNSSIPISNYLEIISQQTYNMSRIDTIFIDDLGEIVIEKGKESETPSINKVETDQYAINNIFVPGGDLSITGNNSLLLSDVSNKNYTMREIGYLEQQIERLTELAALTLLETSAKDLLITDGSGNNRFKNGILVDAFRDMRVANLIDPEFIAAIDKSRTVATPSVIEFPIDLKVDDSAAQGIAEFADVVTLSSSNTVTVIEQKYATNFRNCVSNFYSYDGIAVLDPPFDASYDVTQNPAININIDNAGPTLDLIDTLGEFMPLTVEDPAVISSAGNVGSGPNRVFKVDVSQTTRSLEANVKTSVQNVGNFITDWSMSPYMQSREVRILVTGLRADVEHFFYFEQTSIAANVYPGTIDTSTNEFNVEDVEISGNLGAPVRSDENGTLAAVFRIPAATFFVGQTTLEVVDVDSYANIESASTSYGKALYRAYSFDISKSELSVTTRTVDVSVGTSVTVRSFQVPNPCDPIAQTFMVRTSQTAGASVMYIESLDLFFKKKAEATGITVEIREVVNGYPSRTVLPFARKHIKSSQVNISDDGSLVTGVTFRNPIKLHTEREYCFVVLPDQNSPDYLIWTAKVGSTDQASGAAITNDWGEGVLFTSTNDSAWKSYQDEDIKFTLKRYNFSAQPGTVDLVPNDVEFLTINTRTKNFINDELVYVSKSNQGNGNAAISPDGKVVTLNGTSSFGPGQYILLTKGDGETQIKHLSKIVTVSGSAPSIALTLKTPCNPTTTITVAETGFKASLAVVGRVSYFNKSRGNRLFLRDSSATTSNLFAAGDIVYGYSSGAFATIDTVDNEEISYFQTQIFMNNSIKTSSNLTLYKGGPNARVIDKGIDTRSNTYMMNNLRSINSKSNILAGSATQDFMIRATMTNNGFVAATPILDSALSMLNTYKYNIGSAETTTSKWISKEVTLADNLDAVGLRVYLSAYRPGGTFIDVYARFVYPTDAENQSAWYKLTNDNEDVYSNLLNTRNYREFEYNLPTETNEYSSFQIKIVLRHATDVELEDNEVFGSDGVTIITPGANIFPHVYDYRAIALT